MKQNMGIADRSIRRLVTVLLILFYYTNETGGWDVIWIILAGIIGTTAIVGVCPIYTLLDLDAGSGLKKKRLMSISKKNSDHSKGSISSH